MSLPILFSDLVRADVPRPPCPLLAAFSFHLCDAPSSRVRSPAWAEEEEEEEEQSAAERKGKGERGREQSFLGGEKVNS